MRAIIWWWTAILVFGAFLALVPNPFTAILFGIPCGVILAAIATTIWKGEDERAV